jgi:predicted acylesterase/phospholipase RssA
MESEPVDKIEHLIISGGGMTGFSFYGVLRESNQCGFWKMENIKSIYGTSVGAIFATLISILPYFDWTMLDDYVLKRPWHQLFHFDLETILQSVHNRGIFAVDLIEKLCSPFFEALNYKTDKHVDCNITLGEWYELTHIDLYYVSTELTSFQMEVFHHKTHPNWRVIDAIYCSCALPVLFQPFIDTTTNKMYMDGGLLNNYPAQLCIQSGASPNTILGITKIYDTKDDTQTASSITTVFDYLLFILKQVFEHIIHKPPQIKYQVNVIAPPITLLDIMHGTKDQEERKRLIDHGCKTWVDFCAKIGSPLLIQT